MEDVAIGDKFASDDEAYYEGMATQAKKRKIAREEAFAYV